MQRFIGKLFSALLLVAVFIGGMEYQRINTPQARVTMPTRFYSDVNFPRMDNTSGRWIYKNKDYDFVDVGNYDKAEITKMVDVAEQANIPYALGKATYNCAQGLCELKGYQSFSFMRKDATRFWDEYDKYCPKN